MGGMELMLKSLGFDPAEFQAFLKGMQETLIKFNTDLELIKTKQSELEQNQRAILASCARLADSLDPNPTGGMPGAENG